MCEHCDGSKKPIETEVDGEAYMTLTPDDAEYPEGFMLDFFSKPNEGGIWYSFIVPRCPMCGKTAREAIGR